jgi:hypothetical protein
VGIGCALATKNRPPPAGRTRAQIQGTVLMRMISIFAAIAFSTAAFAQTTTKPLVQVKPKAPTGCKMVGTVKGTKLWAGDCAASMETSPAAGNLPSDDKSPEADQPGLRR